MATKRHKPEEIVAKLRQVEVLVGQGMARVDAIRECPSSDDLGHERLISNGGSGSLGFQSRPRSGDAASGASQLSWL